MLSALPTTARATLFVCPGNVHGEYCGCVLSQQVTVESWVGCEVCSAARDAVVLVIR